MVKNNRGVDKHYHRSLSQTHVTTINQVRDPSKSCKQPRTYSMNTNSTSEDSEYNVQKHNLSQDRRVTF